MSAAVNIGPEIGADRVRMINRSVRCFVFGIMGAVPCFGLSMAGLAFKLFRQVAEEAGERVNLIPLHICTISLVIAGAFTPFEYPGTLMIYGVAMITLQILFLREQYLRNTPAEWNPGRHLAYLGIGLANAGFLLSAAVALWIIYLINHS